MPDTTHNSNFAFLAEHDARLAEIAFEAEQLASISPTACMMQVRMLAELLAKETAAYLGVWFDESTSFYDLLRKLEREDAFRDNVDDLFHEVRMNANDVVHGDVYLGDSKGVAKQYLRIARRIAIWFHQSFGRDPDFSAGPRERHEREARARKAAAKVELDDRETKALIAAQLRARGGDLADYVPPAGSPWDIDGLDYEVPFVFASNGRGHLSEQETGSGILFEDLRRAEEGARPLERWFGPKELRGVLQGAVPA